MALFNLEIIDSGLINTLKIGFGDPSSNDLIVQEVAVSIMALREQLLGKGLLITGVASLPVTSVIIHALCHVVPFIATFDPKLGAFIVVVNHSSLHKIGDLIIL